MESPVALLFFFPIFVALSAFAFFVMTRMESSIAAYTSVGLALAALLTLFYVHAVFGAASVALIVAAYIAALHGGITVGGKIQKLFTVLFYALMISATVMVCLPIIVVVV